MIIDEFHKLYCYAKSPTYWKGVQILKCPLDLWIYQEIIHDIKPDIIIEAGTNLGGSALFFAEVSGARVITIDIEYREGRPQHPRIRYIFGSSVDESVLREVRKEVEVSNTVMVVLDSDHTKDHVLKELEIYQHFVTPGSYMVLEDTNLNGHPVLENFGPGPMEALEEFMLGNQAFESDKSREKFILTFNPRGYLKKKPVEGI
jgi:cephalosporin hydroxylase